MEEDLEFKRLRALERLGEFLARGCTPPDAVVEELFRALEDHAEWVELYGKKYQSLPVPYPNIAWMMLHEFSKLVFFEGAYVEPTGRYWVYPGRRRGRPYGEPQTPESQEEDADQCAVMRARLGLISLELPAGRRLQADAPPGQMLVALVARGLAAKVGDEVLVQDGMKSCRRGIATANFP